MFNAEHLNLFLETADTVVSEPHVFAEINLNDLTNIKQIGVYKYRQSDSDITYRLLPTAFDPNDPRQPQPPKITATRIFSP